MDSEIKVKENGTDEADGTDIGLDRHLTQEPILAETSASDIETQAQTEPSES